MPGLIPTEALGNVKDRYGENPRGKFSVVIQNEPKEAETEKEGQFRLSFGFKILGGPKDGRFINRTLWMPNERASQELAQINYAAGLSEAEFAALKKEGIPGVQYAGRQLNVEVIEREYTDKQTGELKTAENFKYTPFDPASADA